MVETPYELHPYQEFAIGWLTEKLTIEGLEGAALWLDPSLGKTLITLHMLADWKATNPRLRVLIIAPLRVVYSVWPKEIKKWGFDLRISIVHGTERQRCAALLAKADIYLLNFEGVPWFCDLLQRRPKFPGFDVTVFDEQTGFKNWSTGRHRALRRVMSSERFGQRLGLTGTPTPNELAEAFPQLWLLGEGKRLGKHVTQFRERYCMLCEGRRRMSYRVRPEMEAKLKADIAPMVLRMDCRDFLDMPELVFNPVWLRLSPKVMRGYRTLEKQLFLELDSGKFLEASSAAAKYTACRTVVNGGMYERDPLGLNRQTHLIHLEKVKAVEELVEELNGKNVIVAYSFNQDLERLTKAFPKAPVIGRGVKPRESDRMIDAWNAGKYPVLLVQPASLSHGANMQQGGQDLIWFSLTDRPELHTQLNARLWRQGQKGPQVRIHYILAEDTVDVAVYRRIQDKDEGQRKLFDYLKAYQRGELCEG